MERARLILKPKEDIRLRGGHPWVYDNEIASIEGEPTPGSEIEVFDARRRLIGVAFYNPASKIRARIYSRSPRPADEAFFEETLARALEWRRRFFDPERQSLRIAFGEADCLPGLIIDSFVGVAESAGEKCVRGRWISAQFLSLGVESRKKEILAALKHVFPFDGMAERSDASVRALEGLPLFSGKLDGDIPERILIEENDLRFAVDLLGGQKTGWFLDQRANRAAAARFALNSASGGGRRVLDAFCNSGGFALACAAAGASEIVAVDSSPEALASAQANAALNGFSERVHVIEANVFDQLRSFERAHERFGLIILDPPAFAKNRASVEAAGRGYKDLNLRALRLIEAGGVLVTCSCSYWFDRERFARMLEESAEDAGRRLRMIEERTQDLDHPIISGYGESRYLKCVIVEVS
ncbi:MAG: class I SAM-dependent rRNA methyltransferase [Rectinemataceae bacterium]